MRKQYTVSFLYLYVFITGASVMAMELAASRFLAPYYGTSMIVWANIIGLVLLSLSLGYWLGGRLADRRPDGKLLMNISLAAGVFTAFLPFWGGLIFPLLSAGILSTPVWIIACSFLAILAVFAPPIFLLAMVSPFAIRLITDDAGNVGKAAGNLYAFSTLGSLVGTFGSAFGTIPFLGARETIFVCSASLIAISLFGLRRTQSKSRIAFILVPLVLYILTNNNQVTLANGEKVVWAKDTLYQFVQVTENEIGERALIYNEGGGIQSIYRPGDALSTSDYYDDYLLLPYMIDQPREVLILGSAGSTIPRLLAKYVKPEFPGLRTTGVEIDPDVISLGERFFGLQPGDADIINQDARVFINNTKNRYDIVVVDAYTNQIYIPFHLTTSEFFQSVKNRLTDTGVIALNVNATTPDSKLLLSMAKTVKHAFPYSYLVKVRGPYNYILLGSIQPMHMDKLERITSPHPLYDIRKEWPKSLTPLTDEQVSGGMLLTDNRAPTEMLTDSMIFNAVKMDEVK